MKVGQLVKVAAMAGPTVWKLARRAGPVLVRLRTEYPDAYDAIQQQINKLAQARQERNGPAAVQRRVSVLREQVRYLVASADDEAESRRAVAWERDLDGIERALALVVAERRKTAQHHLRRLERRLDDLSGDILGAFIGERGADAEAGGDARGQGWISDAPEAGPAARD